MSRLHNLTAMIEWGLFRAARGVVRMAFAFFKINGLLDSGVVSVYPFLDVGF